MRNAAIIILAIASIGHLRGQWDVPIPIVLNGAQAGDRQVTGLADPGSLNSAMSVNAARDQVASFASTTGGAVLIGSFSPAPTSYAAGMLVTIVPSAANEAGAQLDLNGLGPQEILKQGGLPLDSADLIAGSPVRLIHDGTRFHVVGTTFLPCPAGFHIGGREFCIQDSAQVDTTWYQAVRYCRDMGARLCSFAEWSWACRMDPNFLGTVTNYEWIDSAANNANDAKIVGKGPDDLGNTVIECERGTTSVPTNSTNRNYRCCTNR